MVERSRQELELTLQAALEERDRALAELADARAELNQLHLQRVHPGEPPPGVWTEAGSEALPLRYRVADRLNDGARRFAAPGHAILKRFLVPR